MLWTSKYVLKSNSIYVIYRYMLYNHLHYDQQICMVTVCSDSFNYYNRSHLEWSHLFTRSVMVDVCVNPANEVKF